MDIHTGGKKNITFLLAKGEDVDACNNIISALKMEPKRHTYVKLMDARGATGCVRAVVRTTQLMGITHIALIDLHHNGSRTHEPLRRICFWRMGVFYQLHHVSKMTDEFLILLYISACFCIAYLINTCTGTVKRSTRIYCRLRCYSRSKLKHSLFGGTLLLAAGLVFNHVQQRVAGMEYHGNYSLLEIVPLACCHIPLLRRSKRV